MNKKILFLVFSTIVITAAAGHLSAAFENKTLAHGIFYKANELFKENKYQEAQQEYEKLLGMGIKSGNLYYNLGNAYFKSGNLGKAIVNFERAQQLIPQDSDLRANIAFAESLREHPISAAEPVWIVRVFKYIAGHFTMDTLTLLLVCIYWVLAITLSTGILFKRIAVLARKFVLALALALCISGCLWLVRFYADYKDVYAVVIDKATDSRFAPSEEATTHFKVYEGTKLIIIREDGAWARIKTLDGKIGWVKENTLEKI